MKRLITAACISSWSLAGVALAQPLPGTTGGDDAPPPIKSVAAPAWTRPELRRRRCQSRPLRLPPRVRRAKVR